MKVAASIVDIFGPYIIPVTVDSVVTTVACGATVVLTGEAKSLTPYRDYVLAKLKETQDQKE